jgi:hypothetical protein
MEVTGQEEEGVKLRAEEEGGAAGPVGSRAGEAAA